MFLQHTGLVGIKPVRSQRISCVRVSLGSIPGSGDLGSFGSPTTTYAGLGAQFPPTVLWSMKLYVYPMLFLCGLHAQP